MMVYKYTHARPRSRSSPVPRFSPSVATSETLVVGGGPDTDRLVAGRPRADTCSIPGCACRRPPIPYDVGPHDALFVPAVIVSWLLSTRPDAVCCL